MKVRGTVTEMGTLVQKAVIVMGALVHRAVFVCFQDVLLGCVNCGSCSVSTGKPSRHYATVIPCTFIVSVCRK